MSFYSHAQIPRYKGQGKKKPSRRKSGAKVTRGGRGGERPGPGRPPASCGPPRALSSHWPRVTFSFEMSLSFICDQEHAKVMVT